MFGHWEHLVPRDKIPNKSQPSDSVPNTHLLGGRTDRTKGRKRTCPAELMRIGDSHVSVLSWILRGRGFGCCAIMSHVHLVLCPLWTMSRGTHVLPAVFCFGQSFKIGEFGVCFDCFHPFSCFLFFIIIYNC